MATRMQQRRGTSAQWTSANPVLAAGEIGFETDNNKFKIGDGVNTWTNLAYFLDEDSVSGSLGDYVELALLGVADGVATLDSNGYVPSSQLDIDLTGYATETYVNTAVSNLVDSAPAVLDTLNELAAAIGDDANFITTINTSINTKQDDVITTRGDIVFGNSSNTADRLAVGSADQVLTTDGTDVYWADAAGGVSIGAPLGYILQDSGNVNSEYQTANLGNLSYLAGYYGSNKDAFFKANVNGYYYASGAHITNTERTLTSIPAQSGTISAFPTYGRTRRGVLENNTSAMIGHDSVSDAYFRRGYVSGSYTLERSTDYGLTYTTVIANLTNGNDWRVSGNSTSGLVAWARNSNFYWYSSNGISWTSNTITSLVAINNIIFVDGEFYASGYSGSGGNYTAYLLRSTNGMVNYSTVASFSDSSSYIRQYVVKHNGGTGANSAFCWAMLFNYTENNTKSVWYSSDGINWNYQQRIDTYMGWLEGGNGYFVFTRIAEGLSSNGRYYYSVDGQNWTQADIDPTTKIRFFRNAAPPNFDNWTRTAITVGSEWWFMNEIKLYDSYEASTRTVRAIWATTDFVNYELRSAGDDGGGMNSINNYGDFGIPVGNITYLPSTSYSYEQGSPDTVTFALFAPEAPDLFEDKN